MRLYTFLEDGRERVGAEMDGRRLLDLSLAAGLLGDAMAPAFSSMQQLIEAGEGALTATRRLLAAAPAQAIRPLDALRLAAPLPRPRKIRGFSSFEAHLKQSSEGVARMMAAKEADPQAAYSAIRTRIGLDKIPAPGWYLTPGYYYMDHMTVVGNDEVVQWPAYSNWIDYELEIAAVIGQRCKDVAREDAMSKVFGYTIINDLSARDAQLQCMATGLGVGKGKDFDGSNPMGPCIVTADEIADPYALALRVCVNGQEWSLSSGATAHWRFDQCIAYASQAQVIEPGEVFTTGTAPNSCAIELMRGVKRGDAIELEAEGIGVLRTRIA